MSVDINQIIDMRVNHPEQIGFVMRDRGMGIRPNAKFLMIAADDPARGNLAAGGNPRALEDRWDLLDRLCPVSYTHLDVYKRQARCLRALLLSLPRSARSTRAHLRSLRSPNGRCWCCLPFSPCSPRLAGLPEPRWDADSGHCGHGLFQLLAGRTQCR